MENCDSSVFESKILELVVQCKWSENVWPKWRLLALAYMLSLVIASAAMVLSAAQSQDSLEPSQVVDALQVACALAETIALMYEIHQMLRTGCLAYFAVPWNIIDISASSSLLAGVVCHFAGVVGAESGMHPVGALGCALKWFGLSFSVRRISHLYSEVLGTTFVDAIVLLLQGSGWWTICEPFKQLDPWCG
eukprot:SAG31_NODE_1222_length_9294_cov_4.099184_3_plen_192_part_00